MFIRGANWVPLHAVYAQIDPAEEQFFLRKAVEANLSMLRIWGGGIYESESFFDFCDANGLLIMQDLCSPAAFCPRMRPSLRRFTVRCAGPCGITGKGPAWPFGPLITSWMKPIGGTTCWISSPPIK